jgi:carbonic anhydrase
MHRTGGDSPDNTVRTGVAKRDRRGFLRAALGAGIGLSAALTMPGFLHDAVVFAAEEPRMAPDEALKQLMEGNARYVASKAEHPTQSAARRAEIAKSQHPIAAILGCADSRVPPELLFDQGLGDLFTVRVAGNIADDVVVGSIEYAVEHLGARLVMVLGHERCGAVQAAIDMSTVSGPAPGHLGALLTPIAPAVAQAKTQGGDVLDTAIIANVGNVTAQLKLSHPVIEEMVRADKVKIVGARYDLDTGEVTVVA